MGKVLIADDEINILEVMVEVLESAGHRVTGVHDGEEALKILRAKEFDVAIIDVMMPKIDGYHVAAAIHGLSHPPKILIVTSRDFEQDKVALEASGVDAYLPKPFSNHDLVDVVDTLLARKLKR